LIVALDWVAASSIATAVATLVLAIATFAAVRSANRSARVAERSLLAGLRPLLTPTRLDDPPQKVGFADNRWFTVPGSQGVAEAADGAIYFAIALRNVGSGIAVMHGWYLHTNELSGIQAHASIDDFRRLTRDLYVAPGEPGFWQGAIRDASDPLFAQARAAIESGERIALEVLYGDHELGQRAITLFILNPMPDGRWLATVARQWNVGRADPR
jgi:hypothetical protein